MLNSKCDGARCELSIDVIGATYYLEVVVLPCVSPPAIEVLVENSDLYPVGQWIFDESGNITIVVDGLPIRITSVIKRGTRSIDVQVCSLVTKLYRDHHPVSSMTSSCIIMTSLCIMDD